MSIYSLRYENQRNRIIINLPSSNRNVEVSDRSLMSLLSMAVMIFKKDYIKERYKDVQTGTVEAPTGIKIFESKEGTSGTEG